MPGPKHGYEILQFLDAGLESAWRVSSSQLYVLLKRLEKDGLIVSRLKTQGSRPPKRVFTLTAAGKRSFLDWLRSPIKRARDLRIEFLVKLFFFRVLSLEGGRELVDAQKEVLEKVKQRLIGKEKIEKDLYKKLVLDFKTTTLKAWLQWLGKNAACFAGEATGLGRPPGKRKRAGPECKDDDLKPRQPEP